MPEEPTQAEPLQKATPRRWYQQLVADARQGVVGGFAYVAVGAVGVALFAVLGGTVPAWVFALVVFVVIVVAGLVVAGLQRRVDRLQGELDEARRRGDAEEQAAAQARTRLAEASNGDMPVPLSPRAQRFIRQIRSLRGSAEKEDEEVPTQDLETKLMTALVLEMRRAIGRGESTMDVIFERWTTTEFDDSRVRRHEYLTTLDQLEMLATNLGIDDLQQA